MEKINYQRLLDKIIDENTGKGIIPTLLLHACCAPCSSYCLEYLSKYFQITVYYYNPNITDENEYRLRLSEIKRFVNEFPSGNRIDFVEGEYDPSEYYAAVRGFESCREGGARCEKCFRLRLEKTAVLARQKGFDYFTTTLTISPLKNAEKINRIAREVSEIYDVKCLPSDFKKKDGYKRSTELSAVYGLYRQNYCGCEFSKMNIKDNEDEKI